jgi:hypothetical protein
MSEIGALQSLAIIATRDQSLRDCAGQQRRLNNR